MTSKQHGLGDDEDMDINVDDDEEEFEKSYKATTSETLNMKNFSFSITNILSDSFGPKTLKTESDASDKLFRPFEIKNFINSNTANSKTFNPSSVFLNSFRLSDIFDYSTKNSSSIMQDNNNKSDNSLRNSLYNSFSAYPKIQEEILSSHSKKFSRDHNSSLKIPSSIGGLCKTISQIGQERTLPQTLSTSSSSSHSSSFKCSTPTFQSKSNNTTDTLKLHSSTDSIDSDECQSEASNSKDENKMWPAWVSRHFSYKS